jgi:hypothetical protein
MVGELKGKEPIMYGAIIHAPGDALCEEPDDAIIRVDQHDLLLVGAAPGCEAMDKHPATRSLVVV